jgi:energy-coupling factor transporter ATP-binding protein EcfA2
MCEFVRWAREMPPTAAAADGGPRAVLVLGPTGSGKSLLVKYVAQAQELYQPPRIWPVATSETVRVRRGAAADELIVPTQVGVEYGLWKGRGVSLRFQVSRVQPPSVMVGWLSLCRNLEAAWRLSGQTITGMLEPLW